MVVATASESLSRPSSSALADWTETLLTRLPGAGADSSVLQRRGREQLGRLPVPSRRQEDWRFTDTGSLLEVEPRLLVLPARTPAPILLPELPAPASGVVRLMLGSSTDPLSTASLPSGVLPLEPADLPETLGRCLEATGCGEHWPVALNRATGERILALRIAGAVASTLEFVTDAGGGSGVLPMRVLLVLEPGASLDVLQVHRSEGPSLTTAVFEAHVGPGATLNHGLLAQGAHHASLLAHLAVEQQPRSTYRLTTAAAGWRLARLEPRIVQSGGSSTTTLRALQIVRDRQIGDTHSQVTFAGPEGGLDQLHKAVADAEGRSVFHGAVRVPREAQRTNASQLSRNLLLSDRARIDTKPQLEIVADDVRCAHGATVSRLQMEELFYLQSRGIGAEEAAHLLLQGFCEEIVDELPRAAAVWAPLRFLLQGGQG